MIERFLEYAPWVLGIVFFLVLTPLLSKFFKRKSIQRTSESLPHHRQTQTISDRPVHSYLQSPENMTDDSRNQASDLKPLLQTLIEETQSIRESLYQITEILERQVISQNRDISSYAYERETVSTQHQDLKESPSLLESKISEQMSVTRPQEMEEPPQPLQSKPSGQIPTALTKFCDLCNAGEHHELQTHYQPHYRISVINAIKRRQNPSEPPVFENRTNGKFHVYYIEEKDFYAVVPSYGLVLESLLYGPGAFGDVFDCPNFDPQHSYTVKVISPARFKSDHTKQKWILEKKGHLELAAIS